MCTLIGAAACINDLNESIKCNIFTFADDTELTGNVGSGVSKIH